MNTLRGIVWLFGCAAAPLVCAADFHPGTITTWGRNAFNQLNAPPDLTNVVMVSAGFWHTIALRADGTVVAWGSNEEGETDVPPGLTNVVAVAAGGLHNLALRSDGTVKSWGYNVFGQSSVPAGLSRVVSVACGAYHSLALPKDGTVVCWGRNLEGQCDPPSTATNLIAIGAGGNHTLGLKADGTVLAWGQEPEHSMQPPPDWTNIMAIACGNDFAVALKRDRTVSAWAFSAFGSCFGQTNLPVGLTNVVAIFAGTYHGLALRADGRVLTWGKNDYGEGTIPHGLTNIVALAAGADHSVALLAQQPAWLVAEPADTAVYTGKPARLSVVAAGTAPLIYQWRFEGEDLPGATHAELTWGAVDIASTGQYGVLVSNTLGAVTSRVATLTVIERAPFIVSQPVDKAVLPGCPALFEVTADGSWPLSFEWRLAGAPIPGATNAKFQIPRVTTSYAGNYSVVAANAFGSITSRVATLTVLPLPTGPGSLDPTFDPTATGRLSGIEAYDFPPYVGALLQQADGKVLIGGRFNRINNVERSGLARLNPDGTLDSEFQFVCTNALSVISLLRQPDQKLVFLGRRTSMGEALPPYTGLVRLNPDGSFDSTFSNFWLSAWVPYLRCLALQSDGKILVGGEFTDPQNGIVRFHPDGTLDETFEPPLFPAYDGTGVDRLIVQPDGKILVAGDWGIGLTRLNPDGSEDPSFKSQPEAEPLGMWLLPDGRILVSQTTCCGQCGNLLRLAPNGLVDPSFAVELDIQPLTLLRQPDGRLLVAGTVSDLGRDAPIYLLKPDGTIDTRFQACVHADVGVPRVAAMLLQPDGQILIGGWFSTVNQIPAEPIARLNGEILPVLRALRLSSEGLPIEWTGAPGAVCWIEVTMDFSDWATLGCVTNTPAGTGVFIDSTTNEQLCRFYRVRTPSGQRLYFGQPTPK